jgi:alpha-methylacyl-CoA racemase
VSSAVPGPLGGLRVLEVAAIGPVPFACGLLTDLGAEVLRIDRPGREDGPLRPGSGQARPGITLDLKTSRGRDALLRLTEEADVLVEGMRPGVMERLGAGPETCLQRNPGLIYARMTGWGQDGPLALLPGHDITYAAITGALHSIGTRDKPVPPLNILADFAGGALYMIMGILAAVYERQRSGQGQVLDVAMVDGAASLMTVVYERFAQGYWHDQRQANLLDGGAPFYDTYRCADGRHVAVGALEPQFYAALVEKLGIAGKLRGDRHDRTLWDQHRRVFAEAFATRTRDEWAEHFAGTDACVAPVLSLTEASKHPHLAARDTFVDVDGTVRPGVAPRFSRTPGQVRPRTGREDAEDLLAAWSFPSSEIADLVTPMESLQSPGLTQAARPRAAAGNAKRRPPAEPMP